MQNSLSHYGTKGMRWGVRKYQNPDGSLTAAGRKRYGSSSDLSSKTDAEMQEAVKRKNLENAYRQATKGDDDRLEKSKRLIDASKSEAEALTNLERRVPNRKRKNMDLSNMTDKEMRDAINRKLLERQYQDMFDDSAVNRGRERLRTVLEVGTATLGVASTALGMALAIKQLRE